jgi:leucyl aminopeptidase
MKTQLSFASLAEINTGLLVVLATDAQTSKEPDAKPKPVLLSADPDVKAAAAAVLRSGEFKAGPNETLLLHAPEGLEANRLLIVGVGKQAKVTVHSVRNASGTAVRFAKPRGLRKLVLALPESSLLPPGPCARA